MWLGLFKESAYFAVSHKDCVLKLQPECGSRASLYQGAAVSTSSNHLSALFYKIGSKWKLLRVIVRIDEVNAYQ